MAIRQLTPAEMATLEDQYRNGIRTTESLAETWSVTVDWLRGVAKTRGWVRRLARNGRPMRVFDEAQIRRIRFLVEDGELSIDAIAARYRASRATIANLAQEHGWRVSNAVDVPRAGPPPVDPTTYERALNTLRRRYPLVYSAHVTEGPRGRGFVWVGARRVAAAEAVEMAGGMA